MQLLALRIVDRNIFVIHESLIFLKSFNSVFTMDTGKSFGEKVISRVPIERIQVRISFVSRFRKWSLVVECPTGDPDELEEDRGHSPCGEE